MAYYYDGDSGDSYLDAVIHAGRDCSDSAGDPRPVGEASVDLHSDDVQRCPSCADSDATEMHKRDLAQLIEVGECPWCDDYTGDHVGQHASSAHPEAWADYSDA